MNASSASWNRWARGYGARATRAEGAGGRVLSRLGRLFFAQVCLLAAAAGVLAFRHPASGLTFLGLVWLLDLPRSRLPGRILLLALAFAGAFVYAGLRSPVAPPRPAWLEKAAAQNLGGGTRPPKALRLRARVFSSTSLPGNRLRLILEEAVPADEPGAARYQGRIVWTWRRPESIPLPGQGVEADLRLLPLRGAKNPGAWDIEGYWRDQGVWIRARSGARPNVSILDPDTPGPSPGGQLTAALARTRRHLLDGFLAALPGYKEAEGAARPGARPEIPALSGGAAMLPALIFGERSFLGAEQTELMARSTLAHSLALSGLHLGYAALAALALAHVLGRCRPRLWLHLPRPLAALLLALPLAGIYLWLGQAPLSLQRSACMLLFWAIPLLLKRQKALLDGLLAALAALLLLNPLSLFDLGLQLSILSVAVVALCLPFFSALGRRLFPDCPPLAHFTPETLHKDLSSNPCGQTGAGGLLPAVERLFEALIAPVRPASWTALRRPLPRRFLRWALTLLGMSFCIQLALMPLTVRAFGGAALCFPLNLLWLPALGTLVMPPAFAGLFFSALGLELPARATLYLASLPCEALVHLLRGLDRAGMLPAPLLPRPHWLSAAGFWLLGLILPAFVIGRAGKRRGDILFLLAGLGMCLLPPALALYADGKAGVRLRLLDVGQGQAVLVEWSGLGGQEGPGEGRSSGRALIDGGGFAGDAFDVGKSIVAPILTDNARPRLDLVVNTHPDADHLAGLLFILERFAVSRYLGNGDRPTPALEKRELAALAASGLTRRVVAAGDRFVLAPDLILETLWPEGKKTVFRRKAKAAGAERGNDASLVLRLVWRGRGMALLCGDAENAALRAILNAPLSARVLVLPHHGSARSLTPGFYEAVGPELALAGCGYANKWGFPSAEVRSALRALGIPLHDTAGSGQIRVEWRDPDGPAELEFARPEEGERSGGERMPHGRARD